MFDIQFENVCVTFGETEALKNINLHLEGGKIYGLIGRNGAGKTTLLSLLASYREPDSGKITVNGQKPFETLKSCRKSLSFTKKIRATNRKK